MFPYTDSMVKNFLENSIGFDSLLYSLKEQTNQYPPYDIIKHSNTSYEITLALAGFSKEDIAVIQEKNTVTISNNKKINDVGTTVDKKYIHNGIAKRPFTKKFLLLQNAVISDVSFEDGLLTLHINIVVPEEEKPKQIEIQ